MVPNDCNKASHIYYLVVLEKVQHQSHWATVRILAELVPPRASERRICSLLFSVCRCHLHPWLLTPSLSPSNLVLLLSRLLFLPLIFLPTSYKESHDYIGLMWIMEDKLSILDPNFITLIKSFLSCKLAILSSED